MNEDQIINLMLALFLIVIAPGTFLLAKYTLGMRIPDKLREVTPSSKKRREKKTPACMRNNLSIKKNKNEICTQHDMSGYSLLNGSFNPASTELTIHECNITFLDKK